MKQQKTLKTNKALKFPIFTAAPTLTLLTFLTPLTLLTSLALFPVSASAAGAPPKISPQDAEFFEKKVRPVLATKCFSCHGPEKQKEGLRLDSRVALLKGSDNGVVVVLGDPDKSLLIKSIRQVGEVKMPKKGDKLSDKDIEAMATWVKMGAPWPAGAKGDERKGKGDAKHWAWQPVAKPVLPKVRDARWPQTPIDNFILAKLEAKRMKPAPAAERRTLIRRATFDLIGLPPTPEEIDAFLNDKSPNAYEKVIDRLLASSHYGERWGRYWLDVVRYADTAGESSDYPVPQLYRYRNYVIDSFNGDKPYDQFLREQIAGDILAASAPSDKYGELITATGYLALSRRFGSTPEDQMHLTVEDTIDTLSKSLLATTVGCSRCHDHKFDPITREDYYGLYGFFSSMRFAYPGSETTPRQKDFVSLLPPAAAEAALKPHREKLAALDEEMKRLNKEREEAEKSDLPAPDKKAKVEGLKAAAEGKKRERDLLALSPPVEMAFAVADGEGKNARIQIRGDPQNLGDVTQRKTLSITLEES